MHSNWLLIVGLGVSISPKIGSRMVDETVLAVSWTYRRRPVYCGGIFMALSNTPKVGNWLSSAVDPGLVTFSIGI